MYRLDPLTSRKELTPDPRPDIRTERAGTRSSQPSRQAKANSRARVDLDREISQNDRDFSLLVCLARTMCPKDQTDGLSLMSDILLDFYHSVHSLITWRTVQTVPRSSSSLPRQLQLGRMNLDIRRRVTLTRSDLKSLFDCLSTFSVNFVIS